MDLAPEEIKISKSQYRSVTQDQQLYKFMLHCNENVYSDTMFASIWKTFHFLKISVEAAENKNDSCIFIFL